MSYCSHCGKELLPNARFCQACGNKVVTEEGDLTKRQQEFAGKLIKCPNCGELMDSFELNCPICGYEIRGAKPSMTIKQFVAKLEEIDAEEANYKYTWFERTMSGIYMKKTENQKISLIKNYVIPTTKEDMLEFMLLATASIDYDNYNPTMLHPKSKGSFESNLAWLSRIDQIYLKAKLIRGNDDTAEKICTLRENCIQKIAKNKRSFRINMVKMFGISVAIFFVVPLFLLFFLWDSTPQRLNTTVNEVKSYLEQKDFKHALSVADTIDYMGEDPAEEKKWDNERAYWVDRVIEEAEKAGIHLEYTASEDVDNANKD